MLAFRLESPVPGSRDNIPGLWRFPVFPFLANPRSKQRKRKRSDSLPANGGPETSAISTRRTILFDEVYDNGNAAEKHWIVEYKGVYYILLCEADGWKFKGGAKYASKAACAHLKFGGHGMKGWTEDEAIRHVGIEVLNCDDNRQKMNNEAPERAHVSGNRRRRRGKIAYREPRIQEQRPLKSALDWRPTVFIPRIENFPVECYRTSPETRRITGWSDGYEDGGKRVGNSMHPSGARPISIDLSRVSTRRKDAMALTGTQGEEAQVHESSSEATVETIGRQETLGPNAPGHTAAASGHSLSSRSMASGYISAHSFEVVRSDIAGHDTSEGDAALRSQGRQPTRTPNYGGGCHRGPGSQTQAQVVNSALRACYAVSPNGAGQSFHQTLTPNPRAEHSGTAVSLDGLADEEAGTLEPYPTTMQSSGPELGELNANCNNHSSPRPGHQPHKYLALSQQTCHDMAPRRGKKRPARVAESQTLPSSISEDTSGINDCHRDKSVEIKPRKKWCREDDIKLAGLRQRLTFNEIGKILECSTIACRGRHRRLQNKNELIKRYPFI